MYQSLEKNCSAFHLYVFAFDELAEEVLHKLNLPNLTVVALRDFEDEQLLAVKKERTRAEYCWTSTSSTILYVLKTLNESHCTYLDADMLFYANPQLLLDEVEATNSSVLITSHRYTRRYDQSFLRGTYCVQFMYFKHDEAGLKVLKQWRNDCLEWCYARVEEGKFGDQKYLDNWIAEFDGVHEMRHEGGGLAPWNVQQYQLSADGNRVIRKDTKLDFTVVFFHFHGLQLFENGKFIAAPRSYSLAAPVRSRFYNPYVKRLKELNAELQKDFPTQDFNATGSGQSYWKSRLFKGNVSWVLRNIWFRIFPPRTA